MILSVYARPSLYLDRLKLLSLVARELPLRILCLEPISPELQALEHSGFQLQMVESFGSKHLQLWRAAQKRLKGIKIIHDNQLHLLPLLFEERLRRPGERLLLSSTFSALYTWYDHLRHDWPEVEPGYIRQRWRYLLLERTGARLSDGVLVFGEGHQAPLSHCYGIKEEQVHSLPNCIDPQSIGPCPPDPLPELQGRNRVLVYIGTVFRYKGSWELLEAFARLLPRYPKLRLLMVGPIHPYEERALRARIRARALEDKLLLLGLQPRARIPGLLAAAEALIFPSYLEGSPRAVIEAMACARPIIASRLPGVEALDPKEEFLSLVPRADAAALAEAIERLLESTEGERRRLGEAGRRHYLEAHTPESAAPVWRALYQDLLRGVER